MVVRIGTRLFLPRNIYPLTARLITQTYLEAVKIAEAREAEVKAVFDKYDVDNSGTIEMEELLALLDDLGLVSKLQTTAKDFAIEMFTKYDANDDGVLRCAKHQLANVARESGPLSGLGFLLKRDA